MPRTSNKPPQSAEAARQRRRELWQRDRSQAAVLRVAWPRVDQFRVELTFDDGTRNPPSMQSHVLNPPSRAFFRFPCPFADCDGEYDVSEPIGKLGQTRRGEVSGDLVCEGARLTTRDPAHRCGLALRYKILATYSTET